MPIMIAIGGGVGYVASEAWAPANHSAAIGGDDGLTGHSGHEGHDAVVAEEPTAPPAASEHQHHGAVAPEPQAGDPADSEQEDGSPPQAAPEDHAAAGHGSTAEHAAQGPVVRPRTTVLTTFAAVNVAILLAAALWRRSSRRQPTTRRAAPRAA